MPAQSGQSVVNKSDVYNVLKRDLPSRLEESLRTACFRFALREIDCKGFQACGSGVLVRLVESWACVHYPR
jgi:hypothetical protein